MESLSLLSEDSKLRSDSKLRQVAWAEEVTQPQPRPSGGSTVITSYRPPSPARVSTPSHRAGYSISSAVRAASSMVSRATSRSSEHKPVVHHRSSRWRWTTIVAATGRCLDGRCMVFVSVLFTGYALFGDDFRLIATEKSADDGFSMMALTCLCFFTVEIILKCLSASDYFMSFYFALDLVATASLTLDLTWVSDSLLHDENAKNSGDRARSGRTARVGASMGRVVRVLRLVRVLKLYKAYFEKRSQKVADKADRDRAAPGSAADPVVKRSDSSLSTSRPANRFAQNLGEASMSQVDLDLVDIGDEEEEEEDEDISIDRESLVGKKLVALTTRKVIMLVLMMLLVLPFLTVPSSDVFASSATWGADSVWQAFALMRAGGITRQGYEESLLKYVYYHNWFVGNGGECPPDTSCPRDFFVHVFWIGLAGVDLDLLNAQAVNASLGPAAVAAWRAFVLSKQAMYHLGDMPEVARRALGEPWAQHCSYGGLEHLGVSLLASPVAGFFETPVRCPKDLRPQEILRVRPGLQSESESGLWHMAFFFDMRQLVVADSIFGVLTTCFICTVLCVASLTLSADANALVLRPVERMVRKVDAIRENPLLAIQMIESELKAEDLVLSRRSRTVSIERISLTQVRFAYILQLFAFLKQKLWPERKEEEMMETVFLERTIMKLGTLLALGFGVAGVQVVSNNMRSLGSASVDAMIPGVRVDCIIGVARIRSFSTATEVLQTKIMTFVNQIAEIVHGLVQEYHGAANRNNGDTFLLIWRIESDESRSQLADMSITAFARMLSEVHRSHVLERYRSHPGLQQRLGSHFKVDLSFGLHLGWAVEGAVGSEFKIDASYLSPNVSIAESIEQATRVYRVSIIASETVIDACTASLAGRCRLIDKVIIRGSREPLKLHSLDLDTVSLVVREPKSIEWNVRQRFKARQLLEVSRQRKMVARDIFKQESGKDVRLMRRCFTPDFFQLFNMGYQNYSEGEWAIARRILLHTESMLGVRDGPSSALLAYMERPYAFEAPHNWNGVRELEPT